LVKGNQKKRFHLVDNVFLFIYTYIYILKRIPRQTKINQIYYRGRKGKSTRIILDKYEQG